MESAVISLTHWPRAVITCSEALVGILTFPNAIQLSPAHHSYVGLCPPLLTSLRSLVVILAGQLWTAASTRSSQEPGGRFYQPLFTDEETEARSRAENCLPKITQAERGSCQGKRVWVPHPSAVTFPGLTVFLTAGHNPRGN